jgi:hypothetical protein
VNERRDDDGGAAARIGPRRRAEHGPEPSYRVVAASLVIEAGRIVASYDGPGGDGA